MRLLRQELPASTGESALTVHVLEAPGALFDGRLILAQPDSRDLQALSILSGSTSASSCLDALRNTDATVVAGRRKGAVHVFDGVDRDRDGYLVLEDRLYYLEAPLRVAVPGQGGLDVVLAPRLGGELILDLSCECAPPGSVGRAKVYRETLWAVGSAVEYCSASIPAGALTSLGAIPAGRSLRVTAGMGEWYHSAWKRTTLVPGQSHAIAIDLTEGPKVSCRLVDYDQMREYDLRVLPVRRARDKAQWSTVPSGFPRHSEVRPDGTVVAWGLGDGADVELRIECDGLVVAQAPLALSLEGTATRVEIPDFEHLRIRLRPGSDDGPR